jgi:adenylate cyclase
MAPEALHQGQQARGAGHRVRVTAQLVDATTGNHLWAERYDRELKEIFTVQE